MNQLENFLAARRRREAQVMAATIDSAVGDGTGDYYCIVTVTGERVRASVSENGITFDQRYPVLLTQPDDGTIAKTSGFVIQENRTVATQGDVYTAPSDRSTDFDDEAIEVISPESATFVASQTQTIHIYGAGLADADLDYGTNDLTDAATPTKTDRSITLSLTADPTPALGTFDLTVGDVVFPDFFTITA